jgi:hypothetical protein
MSFFHGYTNQLGTPHRKCFVKLSFLGNWRFATSGKAHLAWNSFRLRDQEESAWSDDTTWVGVALIFYGSA